MSHTYIFSVAQHAQLNESFVRFDNMLVIINISDFHNYFHNLNVLANCQNHFFVLFNTSSGKRPFGR